jgi:hypothetical protein
MHIGFFATFVVMTLEKGTDLCGDYERHLNYQYDRVCVSDIKDR